MEGNKRSNKNKGNLKRREMKKNPPNPNTLPASPTTKKNFAITLVWLGCPSKLMPSATLPARLHTNSEQASKPTKNGGEARNNKCQEETGESCQASWLVVVGTGFFLFQVSDTSS